MMEEFHELAASVKRDVMKLQSFYDPQKQPELTRYSQNGTPIKAFDEMDIPQPPQLHAILFENLAVQMDNVENVAERNGVEPQAFTTPAEENTDSNATTNFVGEVYVGTPESTLLPAPLNLLPDRHQCISAIIVHPSKKVFVRFTHGFITQEIPIEVLPKVIERSVAAPTLTFKSEYTDEEMFKDHFDFSAAKMNAEFYAYCHTIKFRGVFNSYAISALTYTIPRNVKCLNMTKITLAGPYKLNFPITGKPGLQRLVFDCRVTEIREFTQNCYTLKLKFRANQLQSIRINVTGFPADAKKFRETENNIVDVTQNDGICTILTEEHCDDTILKMLKERNYVYVGHRESAKPFHPFENCKYHIFNKEAQRNVTITIGFLKRYQ